MFTGWQDDFTAIAIVNTTILMQCYRDVWTVAHRIGPNFDIQSEMINYF